MLQVPKRPPTVLIVDDEEETCDLLSSLLETDDYRILRAHDGHSAIDMAVQETPDIILLDVVLPKFSGLDVCKKLRADPRLRDIPVLLMSGYSVDETALQALQLGADDIISKPFHLSELKMRVATILKLDHFRVLRNQQRVFEWVVEQSSDGYLMIGEDGNAAFHNEAARQMLGLEGGNYPESPRDFRAHVGEHFRLEPPHVWETWPRLLSTGYLVRAETPQNPATWIEVKTQSFEESGHPWIVVRLKDVSPQVRHEQGMWAFERMVAHKLQTPLNGLSGALELLSTVEDEDMSFREVASLAYTAREASERIKEAVRAILGHLDSQVPGMPADEPVADLLETYVQTVPERFPGTAVTVEIDPETRGQRSALAEEHLDIILDELCGNSMKFHPTRTPQLSFHLESGEGHSLSLRVCDDGRRVNVSALSRLNLPFFQVDLENTGEIPGMGLGLARIHALLINRGGRMEARNREDGEGLEVALLLPVVD